jgi:Ca-activated chloride channel homolog
MQNAGIFDAARVLQNAANHNRKFGVSSRCRWNGKYSGVHTRWYRSTESRSNAAECVEVTRMSQSLHRSSVALVVGSAALFAVAVPRLDGQEEFRFRSAVELINVTATVTDTSGHFVSGLEQTDFLVYEDERPVDITYFSAERVPVSLGIVLDTSGSMAGEKIDTARSAIERFLDQLPNPGDEVFLFQFADDVDLRQDWTTDRATVGARLRYVRANGGTVMYDAVMEAVPKAQDGRHRKKAILLISDGDDTNSRAGLREVRDAVRETEVLIYAVGIDGPDARRMSVPPRTRPRRPIPFPVPGRRPPGRTWPAFPQLLPWLGGVRIDSRLNVRALREITDDSGGRTEIVRSAQDLNAATASIADELSKQYYLGYTSLGHRDGRWHTLRVDMRKPSLRVRARKGYIAASQESSLDVPARDQTRAP